MAKMSAQAQKEPQKKDELEVVPPVVSTIDTAEAQKAKEKLDRLRRRTSALAKIAVQTTFSPTTWLALGVSIAHVIGIVIDYVIKKMERSSGIKSDMSLSDYERELIKMYAEATFPKDESIPYTTKELGVEQGVEEFINGAPDFQRAGLRLLVLLTQFLPIFATYEKTTFTDGIDPKNKLFSNLSTTDKQKVLDSYKPDQYTIRTILAALRMPITMAFCNHPTVANEIGMEPNLDPFSPEKSPK